jgi:uncharacterized membrane protein YkvI
MNDRVRGVHCSNGFYEFDSHTTTNKYKNMTKKLENRWAEIIMIVMITIVLMSSCSVMKYDSNGSLIRKNGSTHCSF